MMIALNVNWTYVFWLIAGWLAINQNMGPNIAVASSVRPRWRTIWRYAKDPDDTPCSSLNGWS